jgi:hypothetical protein
MIPAQPDMKLRNQKLKFIPRCEISYSLNFLGSQPQLHPKKTGTEVKIFKIFSPKIMAKYLAFFVENMFAGFRKIWIVCM